MNLRNTFFMLAFCMLFAGQLVAQEVKIGYTNIELILAYYPEANQVNQELGIYQKKLAEQIASKETFAEQKLQEYMQKKEQGAMDATADEAAQKELLGLDQEIKEFAAEQEQKLMKKRESLLIPVLEKLQAGIDAVAKENNFTYILNQTTSSGVSTILYGPEENDVTELVMKNLGIEIPKE